MLSPLTLLFDLTGIDYYDVLDELVVALRKANASVRVKGGALLELDGGRRRIQMSEYRPGTGRRLETSSRSRDLANTRLRFAAMFSAAEKLYVSSEFAPSELLGNAPECISFSDVDEALAERLTEIARRSGTLMVALRWNESDVFAGDHLWRSLILTRVVTEGVILADFEEFPLNEIFDEDLLRWRRSRDPWPPADGFFFSHDSVIYPEEAFEHITTPVDLEPPEPPTPPRSPVERALDAVGLTPVLRISARATPNAPGRYDAPYPHLQYPDVALIERKVRDYCLNPTHAERKWEGFAAHGWDGGHPTHSVQLASLLASALLLPFTPLDVRATADGAIQFGALVALPSFRYGYAPVMTAWVAKPGAALQLASAFVTSSNGAYLDPTFPFEPSSCVPWRDIVDRAVRFGNEAAYDDVTAQARLFISRYGRGNTLTRWLVRMGESHGEFRRAAVGGRCLLVPVGGRCGWVQAGRTTAHAQISLGLNGILSMPGAWVD